MTKGYLTKSPRRSGFGQGGGVFCWDLLGREQGLSPDWTGPSRMPSVGKHGTRPDYGSGPHLQLMAEAVGLARRDLFDPLYSAGARAFLESDLVALFAECIGIDEGRFLSG